MTDHHEGLVLGREAWDLYERGSLQEAASRYAEAVRVLPESHYYAPDLHRERAMVLVRLGCNDEALREYQISVALESRQNPDEAQAPMVVGRYFLAEHLLRMGRGQDALEAIGPSIGIGAKTEGIARLVQAQALLSVGRVTEARQAAQEAIRLCSEKQRSSFEEQLHELL